MENKEIFQKYCYEKRERAIFKLYFTDWIYCTFPPHPLPYPSRSRSRLLDLWHFYGLVCDGVGGRVVWVLLGAFLGGLEVVGCGVLHFLTILLDATLVIEPLRWLQLLLLFIRGLLILLESMITILIVNRIILTILHISSWLLLLLRIQPPHLLLHEFGIEQHEALLHDLE